MKTLIIYTSQTGFTKRYAEWIAERMSADLLDLKEARKKKDEFFEPYDAIVYGGWVMAGNPVKSKWFLDKASAWKNKRLAVFCVGGSPDDNPDVEVFLSKVLTDEQRKYIKAFYCQGGFNYEKMNGPSRLAMKMFKADYYSPHQCASINSRIGWAGHCDSDHFIEREIPVF